LKVKSSKPARTKTEEEEKELTQREQRTLRSQKKKGRAEGQE
jgi:hypothetical protein